MNVEVERCWGGNNRCYFRLTLPDGSRETVTGGSWWTRATATEALNLLEVLYGVQRRGVRFVHMN